MQFIQMRRHMIVRHDGENKPVVDRESSVGAFTPCVLEISYLSILIEN